MKQTLTVNLNSTVFHIDSDAYEVLHQYLREIEQHFCEDERKEIMSDIEARIGEILTERLGAHRSVISEEDVEQVKLVLGMPSQFTDSEDDEENANDKHNKSERKKYRRYYRDIDNQMLGGVLSGLAAYLKWDVTVVRLLFLIVTIFGFGWLGAAYFVVWMVTPEARTAGQKLSMRGENPTLDNIKNYVESEQFKDSVNTVGHRVLEVARPLIKMVMLIVGVGFAMLSISFIAALVITTIASVYAYSTGDLPVIASSSSVSIQYLLRNSALYYCSIISFGLTLLIPLVSVAVTTINVIFSTNNKKAIRTHAAVKWTAFITWILALLGLISIVTYSFYDTRFFNDDIKDTISKLDEYANKITGFNPSDAKRIEVGHYTALQANSGISVTIEDADSNHIMVDAPRHLIDKFTWKIDDGTLQLHYDRLRNNEPMEDAIINVVVYRKNLTAIEAEAACKIKSVGKVYADSLWLDADAASIIDVDVVCKKVEGEADEASKIDINATCEYMWLNADAASVIEAKAHGAKNIHCMVNAASKLDADFRCDSIFINIDAASKASIEGKTHYVYACAKTTSECEMKNLTSFHAQAMAYSMSKIWVKAEKISLSSLGMSRIIYMNADGSGKWSKGWESRCDETSEVKFQPW